MPAKCLLPRHNTITSAAMREMTFSISLMDDTHDDDDDIYARYIEIFIMKMTMIRKDIDDDTI